MTIKTRGELCKLLHHFSLPMIVAEIGVAEGRFSEEIYNWGVKKLYLVDLWENFPFIEGCASFSDEWHYDNFKRVTDVFANKPEVNVIRGFSHKIAKTIQDESLGLIYIDCDHTYQGVKADIAAWWPKLVSGGIMAFHDYHDEGGYGVKRAVTEHTKNESLINVILEDGNVENRGAWIRK